MKLKFYEFAGHNVGKCLYESALGSGRRLNVKARFTRSFLAQLLGLRVCYRVRHHNLHICLLIMLIFLATCLVSDRFESRDLCHLQVSLSQETPVVLFSYATSCRKRGARSLRFLGDRLREVRPCLELLVCFTFSLCKFVATAFPYCLNFDTLSVVHNHSILKVTISSFIGVKSSTSRRLTRRAWDWFSLKRSTICRGA